MRRYLSRIRIGLLVGLSVGVVSVLGSSQAVRAQAPAPAPDAVPGDEAPAPEANPETDPDG